MEVYRFKAPDVAAVAAVELSCCLVLYVYALYYVLRMYYVSSSGDGFCNLLLVFVRSQHTRDSNFR